MRSVIKFSRWIHFGWDVFLICFHLQTFSVVSVQQFFSFFSDLNQFLFSKRSSYLSTQQSFSCRLLDFMTSPLPCEEITAVRNTRYCLQCALPSLRCQPTWRVMISAGRMRKKEKRQRERGSVFAVSLVSLITLMKFSPPALLYCCSYHHL